MNQKAMTERVFELAKQIRDGMSGLHASGGMSAGGPLFLTPPTGWEFAHAYRLLWEASEARKAHVDHEAKALEAYAAVVWLKQPEEGIAAYLATALTVYPSGLVSMLADGWLRPRPDGGNSREFYEHATTVLLPPQRVGSVVLGTGLRSSDVMAAS